MPTPKLLFVATAALLIAACEARIGNDATEDGNASAAGKAEEGQLSIDAPGFEMKIDIPEGIQRQAGIDDNNGIIYPNSRFSGIHVEGGASGSEGEVELRFTSADSPDMIGRWYRDPARAGHFSVSGTAREGDSTVISGTTREDGGQFRVSLAPAQGGGTDARILLSDRR